jgi:GR25 family glycosyltransferase involved in LPS biosynthesis
MFKIDDIDWYYINLASRPDRSAHARDQFSRHGITAHRFEALTPDDWRGDPARTALMRAKTPGAVGCYLSQMRLIQLAENSGRIVAVCEDDVCFCDDLLRRLEHIAEHLTWDWDIFYLGATFHVPGQWCHREGCAEWGSIGVDVEPTDDPRILRTYGIWGTYAYLVNPKNAANVYRLFDDNVHRARGIDDLAIILGPRLNAYCFVPGCAWQYDDWSNIRVGGYTRFSNFKSLGPYVWTDRMEDFDPAGFDWEKGVPT